MFEAGGKLGIKGVQGLAVGQAFAVGRVGNQQAVFSVGFGIQCVGGGEDDVVGGLGGLGVGAGFVQQGSVGVARGYGVLGLPDLFAGLGFEFGPQGAVAVGKLFKTEARRGAAPAF